MWVRKEANLIILLGRLRKLGQIKRVRMREKPMLWLPFLYGQVSHQTQQCHYSANNKPSPYPQPNYPQRPSLNLPQSLSTALPMTNTTFSTNQKKHQQKGILQQKACRVHPKFCCHMLNLIPYLLDNSNGSHNPSQGSSTSISPRIRLKRNVCLSRRSPGAFLWAL